MSKYEVFSGPYFPVFGLNKEIYGVISVFSAITGKYGPEKTPYLGTFHAVTGWNNEPSVLNNPRQPSKFQTLLEIISSYQIRNNII